LTVSHLHSYISWRGYLNGLGAMHTEERMVARMAASAGSTATKAAKRDAKWTVEVDATIERMIDDGVSFAEISSKLGNDLTKMDIYHRWNRYLKKSSSITKPPVQPGPHSRITWTEDVDASIVRMRAENISFPKIASELGNGLSKSDIGNRWNHHLKDKLQ